MNISHIEHIGIAVVSLETAIPYYETLLGTKCYATEVVADQKVKTAFFKVGQTKLNCWNLPILKALLANFWRKKDLAFTTWPLQWMMLTRPFKRQTKLEFD